ncbi:serine/threonine-protein kinase [Pendulispora albinea]|uniref:Serine/threonine protein kinase n=1 Tax=Pendulispora albinea TaxID=2741071 RepID=A0ABZ2LR21_9BACT
MTAAVQSFEPGTILLGRYRVEKIVGRGGMGVVLAAWDTELLHHVAIKVLVGLAFADSEPVERFMREARITVKLTSDHVVRVINAGTLESGAPYIVMDLLEGHDLGGTHHPLAPAVAVDYVLQAIDAVAEAHAQGIIHRDLKPSNLFLATRTGASPIIKVLDFGISKASPLEGDPSLTGTTSIMGSPRYMSPEQFRSAKLVDERTDVWALGAIAYHLMSGAPPFEGSSVGEVFEAVSTREPIPLRGRRPEVPMGLEHVIARCLQKNPKERFQTVADLAQALGPFGTGEWQRCVVRAMKLLEGKSTQNLHAVWMMPTETAIAPPAPSAVPPAPEPPWRSKRWLALGFAGLFALLLSATALGAFLAIAWTKRHPPAAPAGMTDPVGAVTGGPVLSSAAVDSGVAAADLADAGVEDAGAADAASIVAVGVSLTPGVAPSSSATVQTGRGTGISPVASSSSGASNSTNGSNASNGSKRRVLTDFQRSRLLGHYSTFDGASGFVLDRLEDPWRAKLDGESSVKILKSRPGSYGTMEYVNANGEKANGENDFWIRVQKDTGEVLLFDGPKQFEGVKVVRDADARPLR